MKMTSQPHYLAVCRSLVDGRYFITNHLYESDAQAQEELGSAFHLLWKTGPSLMLEMPEKKKVKKAVKPEEQDELPLKEPD